MAELDGLTLRDVERIEERADELVRRMARLADVLRRAGDGHRPGLTLRPQALGPRPRAPSRRPPARPVHPRSAGPGGGRPPTGL
jgi:hypothetical protein